MKLFKTLVIGALLLASVSAANAATTYFRFTGSTAYRTPASVAVCNVLTQNSNTFIWAYTGTGGGTGANAQIWSGTINGIGPVIIKATWTGSEAGIQTVSQAGTGLAILFLHDNNLDNVNNTGNPATAGTSSGGGGQNGAPDPTATGAAIATTSPDHGGLDSNSYTNFESVIPDACMSDTFQGTSAFQGTFKAKTYAGLTEDTNSPIGVVPFTWCATPGSTITNMTDQTAVTQYTSPGTLPLSFYTGNASDSSTTVYATGRNPDSGTRATAFIDTGIGVLSTVVQYEPIGTAGLITGTAAGQTISSVAVWPKDTVNGVAYALGLSGYNSGGKEAGGLSSTPSAGTQLIGYLGVPDAINAIIAGATQVSYNGSGLNLHIVGSASAPDYTPIYNGQYTFWGYEHMLYRGSTLTSPTGASQVTIADTIALAEKSTAIVPLSSMTVGRFGYDGGNITNGASY